MSEATKFSEITWHRPSRHNDSHEGTSKQTPSTPGRSESGETQNRVRRKVKHELRGERENKASSVFRARSESTQCFSKHHTLRGYPCTFPRVLVGWPQCQRQFTWIRANHKLNLCDPIVNVEGVLMLWQLRSEFQFEDVTWGKLSLSWLSVQKVKLQHLSLRPTLNGTRRVKHTSNPHLGFPTASLDDSLCRNADVGILHRNYTTSRFWASVNLRASHRLSVCV